MSKNKYTAKVSEKQIEKVTPKWGAFPSSPIFSYPPVDRSPQQNMQLLFAMLHSREVWADDEDDHPHVFEDVVDNLTLIEVEDIVASVSFREIAVLLKSLAKRLHEEEERVQHYVSASKSE